MLTDRDSLLRKLHELRSEHRDLDTVIARLADQGAADQLHLQRLKKRKLMLKDEIAWLESRLIPSSLSKRMDCKGPAFAGGPGGKAPGRVSGRSPDLPASARSRP
jgi:hypothetical protein